MRTVIKIGTSTLTHPTGNMDLRRMEKLCRVVSDLKNSGVEIVLVSSGAIGMGAGKLSLRERPRDMATKQAAAAVGQCELMYAYDRHFAEYGHVIAQILLTGEELGSGQRSLNFRSTLERLLEMGVLPIINENDTVATEEIAVGDNDTLAAMVAAEARADLLILLSDIDGLFTADPRKDPAAKLIPWVTEITPELEALAGDPGSSLGTGGMRTKLHAARLCLDRDIDMVILNGSDPGLLYDVFDGKAVGTRFSTGRDFHDHH